MYAAGLEKTSPRPPKWNLQNARNSLKTERNAYIDDYIYKREHPLQTFGYLLDESIQIINSRFQKRLDVINELLKERLQEARGK